jgi:hypothetical protein
MRARKLLVEPLNLCQQDSGFSVADCECSDLVRKLLRQISLFQMFFARFHTLDIENWSILIFDQNETLPLLTEKKFYFLDINDSKIENRKSSACFAVQFSFGYCKATGTQKVRAKLIEFPPFMIVHGYIFLLF